MQHNRACGKARFAGRGPRSRGAVSCAEETWPDGTASSHGTPEEREASVPPAAQRWSRQLRAGYRSQKHAARRLPRHECFWRRRDLQPTCRRDPREINEPARPAGLKYRPLVGCSQELGGELRRFISFSGRDLQLALPRKLLIDSCVWVRCLSCALGSE